MKLTKDTVSNYCSIRKVMKRKVETLISLLNSESDSKWMIIDYDIMTLDRHYEIVAKVFNTGWKEGKRTTWKDYYCFPIKYLFLTKPQIMKEFIKDIESGKMDNNSFIKPFPEKN